MSFRRASCLTLTFPSSYSALERTREQCTDFDVFSTQKNNKECGYALQNLGTGRDIRNDMFQHAILYFYFTGGEDKTQEGKRVGDGPQ